MAGQPVKPYTEVESEFTRAKIIDGDFDNVEHRRYVNELVAIESFILGGVHGFPSGMKRNQLGNRYAAEYDIIHEELDPEGHAERKRRKAEIIQRTRDDVDPEVIEEARRDWAAVASEAGTPF